ncbi:hypothetical protein [Sorangium sp. So ce1335]
MNRQDAKDAKKKTMSWRLGGSKLCSFQARSTRWLLQAPVERDVEGLSRP